MVECSHMETTYCIQRKDGDEWEDFFVNDTRELVEKDLGDWMALMGYPFYPCTFRLIERTETVVKEMERGS